MDFKKPSITEFFRAQREARGNGSNVSRLHAVPTPAVEQMALATALAKIDTIETALASARDAARAAARRAGVSGDYLFGATAFIPRSTGCRWADEARAEAREQTFNETVALFAKINAPPSPEYAALGRAVRAAVARGELKGYFGIPRDGGEAPLDPEAAEQARIEAEAKILAEKILAAGERARSDGSNERPEPTGKAKAYLGCC